MENHSRQEALAEGNSKGNEDNDSEGGEERESDELKATRAMMETFRRGEGDNGHNNQLGTKAMATARTVVATAARATTMMARATGTVAKRAKATTATMATMAMMVTTVMMMPNGNKDAKWQQSQ
jgi:hypothetical protein